MMWSPPFVLETWCGTEKRALQSGMSRRLSWMPESEFRDLSHLSSPERREAVREYFLLIGKDMDVPVLLARRTRPGCVSFLQGSTVPSGGCIDTELKLLRKPVTPTAVPSFGSGRNNGYPGGEIA